eukprot:6682593-Pyramimonas_sp.AAC.1
MSIVSCSLAIPPATVRRGFAKATLKRASASAGNRSPRGLPRRHCSSGARSGGVPPQLELAAAR